jgi:glycyl-tRNA synthetase beta subunit
VKDPRTLPLLVEIGCEEIPARFLAEAQVSFGARLEVALREARLLAVKSMINSSIALLR